MKKVLAFLLLLSYMNTSMFIDNIADDEDDDTSQVFHIPQTIEHCLSQPVTILQEKKPEEPGTSHFTEHRPAKIKAVAIDKISPPPDTRAIA